ncbi:HAMP domain-containing sensor histidine kinase [Nocardiopsis sp. RSe5-2]|uniref:histidine kinase n=1 Tax=Nocardiopsis endophytica TaxID=3018445 RepID=A0ABT4UA24_9ACTN|nr:HAMP domain-containing sensor histidine kinase [Nocardiopsis endophytica]MDA2813804.1 HAMP domain-containing sensor histidine kinase [Nocardiopsis endophytica]
MRRRMLFSTLVVTVIAVLLLGLPLGALVYRSAYEEAERALQQDADVIAADADAQLQNEGGIDVPHFAQVYPDLAVRLTPPGSDEPVRAGGWDYSPGTADTRAVMDAETVSSGGVRVEVWRGTRPIQESVFNAWLGIASLSLLAIGVAVGLAILQARRLTLPLVDLAATAERLGSGVATPWGHRYGIPEADRVAEVLDRSAERIAGLIATERHFATDASHQLRTPLTALTMRLEEIIAEAGDPDVVREEGEAALQQAERLTQTVESLLGRARKSQNPEVEPVSVDRLLERFVAEWSPMFRQNGRRLRLTGAKGMTAMTVPMDLTQIMAVLVENAAVHGRGTVTVHVVDGGHSVRIEVGDEGEGVPEHLVGKIFDREVSGAGGTGLGLALARHIAESEGARLELVQANPPTFAVFLPVGGEGLDKATGPV